MSLELVPLCSATVSLAETIAVSSTFVIGEVTAVRMEGERLRADMLGRASADWLTVSPEGHGLLDVRVTVKTDDGAVIHATYNGRLLFDTMTVFAAPTFHTGDERYLWLNRIQAAAKGHFTDTGQLVYEMYELR